MEKDIEYILVSESDIATNVARLADEINDVYTSLGVDELIVIGLLNGSIVFLSDLIRKIHIPLSYDFMRVSSYGSGTVAGELNFKKDIEVDIIGKHVLIVEDIIDTGKTLSKVTELLANRGAASVKICTFLDKPERRVIPVDVDFQGVVIPDKFVVGYGLDYAEKYRQLPYIGVLKNSVWE